MPTALGKMTIMPAERLGLDNRGRLSLGAVADITIFNPETVADNSKFTDPHYYPSGIEYVIINGKVTVDQGEMTATRAGRLIRKK